MKINLDEALKDYRIACIVDALEFHGYNKTKAAESLGMKRTTLVEFIAKVRPDLLDKKNQAEVKSSEA